MAQMLEHHASQGVEAFIITDNGSVDGTWEILKSFAANHEVDLRRDPVHRMQQFSTVTQMARDAYDKYGATWVINADADEFWRPKVGDLTLAEALAHVPTRIRSFPVDVVNLTGLPARDGTGLDRLVYRDVRSNEQLSLIGLRAQPTHNCIHIGSPDVQVVQGNHWTSLQSRGVPAPEFEIEALHLPWRSWEQYRRKIDNMGRGYSENPVVTPSPNHHGMRDYHRLLGGTLEALYVLRHPLPEDIATGTSQGWLVEEKLLADEQLGGVPDTLYHPEAVTSIRQLCDAILAMEKQYRDLEAERDTYRGELAMYMQRLDDEYNLRISLEKQLGHRRFRHKKTT